MFVCRNRMAQRANRASVVLNTQFMLEGKPKLARGFITQLKENGVQIVVPNFGVDSIVEFPADVDAAEARARLRLFQEVSVRLSVTERNQRRYLNMELIKPALGGAAGGDSEGGADNSASAEAQPTEISSL